MKKLILSITSFLAISSMAQANILICENRKDAIEIDTENETVLFNDSETVLNKFLRMRCPGCYEFEGTTASGKFFKGTTSGSAVSRDVTLEYTYGSQSLTADCE